MEQSSPTKVTVAASIGSFIVWYDYFVATTAAVIVWPAIFFPKEPGIALILSLTTILATKASAPIGSAIFGHYGDRLGRRGGMTWTLLITGLASLGVALTPGYAALGILSAVLIFALRIAAGIGKGGEYGQSVTWVSEAAHGSKWRGFWGSWVGSAVQLGTIASSLSFSIIAAALPSAAFLQWGWRLLFVIGSLAALVGIVIRLRAAESPLFLNLKERGGLAKSPVTEVARKDWRTILLLLIPFGALFGVGNLVGVVGGQAFLKALHVPLPVITLSVAAAATVALFAGIGFAVLSDMFPRGRKWILIAVMILVAAGSTIAFRLYELKSTWGVVLGMISVFGLSSSTSQIFPSLLTDQFGTRTRTSGSGLISEFGALLSGLYTSPLLPIIISIYGGSIVAASYGLTMVAIPSMAIGIVFLLVLKEKRPTDLSSETEYPA
ncbi:MAG: MFS transporter [Nitrososphaerota archaeon]|nr:MFS transporter [Nitrososphaerota archaeon]